MSISVPSIHTVFRPIQRYFRPTRMRIFERSFGVTESTTVLDIGGYATNWSYLDQKPRVILINLSFNQNQIHEANTMGFPMIIGDGCSLPFADNSFDIVYSNSTIEHLFTPEKQREFAGEVRRVGRSYYVQTPNSRFFVEPHYLAPFVHWIPIPLRRRILRYASVWGWLERPNQAKVDAMIAEIRLLDSSELKRLFPESTIVEERLGTLVKSLQAEFLAR